MSISDQIKATMGRAIQAVTLRPGIGQGADEPGIGQGADEPGIGQGADEEVRALVAQALSFSTWLHTFTHAQIVTPEVSVNSATAR